MNTNDKDKQAIAETIKLYFMGTYQGDAQQLHQAFHPEARIIGSIQGQIHDWSLNEFIARVTTALTAKDKNEKFDKEIILIDYVDNAAMVKARVVVSDLVFVDYITLLKINGHWLIRNKSFTAASK